MQELEEVQGTTFRSMLYSQRAWRQAIRVDDKDARMRLLEEVAPGGQTPVVAEAIGLPSTELSESQKARFHSLEAGKTLITFGFAIFPRAL